MAQPSLTISIPCLKILILVLKFFLLLGVVSTAKFTIVNNCSQTIWPASSSRQGASLPISGFTLEQGQYLDIDLPSSWNGQIWGRTLCSNHSRSQNVTCVTGDCGSGKLECPDGMVNSPATTLVEFAMDGFNMLDFYDVSLVGGFNLPVLVTPLGDRSNCSSTGCVGDINGVCPPELQVNGTDGEVVACMGPCTAFKQDQYCCVGTTTCGPTSYSRLFKSACPTAYSYPQDDATSTFTCSGTDYVITFCPSSLNSSFVRFNGSQIVAPSSPNCTSYNCSGITPARRGIVNSSYPQCPSYNCGGITVGYPFWQQDNTSSTQYCGYSGFGVNCSTTGGPILRLPNDIFHIRNINYDNHTLTLVDTDFVNQTCPRAHHNLSLGSLPLYYVPSNSNLSFHFNCNSSPSLATPIACLGSNRNQSYVSLVGTESDDFNWFEYCEENVVVSVMDSAVDRINLSSTFGRAMNQGFMLNWMAPSECRKCETFGGRCGSNRQTGKFLCFCNDGTTTTSHCMEWSANLLFIGSKTKKLLLKIGIGAGSALIGFLLICFIFYYKTRKSSSWELVAFWRRNALHDKKVEAFILQYGASTPKRYRYSDIKRMTNSFKDKLGQGGYGIVFKGKLADNRLVAVKVLNASKGNGEEFMNEVASIGRTSHVNIVTLLGFCYEGRKRALIYEFMPNGSLDKFIHENNHEEARQHLGVEKLYEIALGIARGLEYLHFGCNTRILHLDIKPHNILLDEDFCPKIADFGLAKPYTKKKKSNVSMLEARGTIGYIAPEVFNRNLGGVSHKSDVYSYGMLVIEIVGGRNNSNAEAVCSSEIYFPNWIYKRFERDEDLQLQQGPMTSVENEIARKMILVGLWCIQTDPSQRPSMSKVIEMLEGSLEALEVPPRPFFSSSPTRPTTNTSTTSF